MKSFRSALNQSLKTQFFNDVRFFPDFAFPSLVSFDAKKKYIPCKSAKIFVTVAAPKRKRRKSYGKAEVKATVTSDVQQQTLR